MQDEILPGDNQQLIAETKVLIAKNTELIDKLTAMTEEASPPLVIQGVFGTQPAAAAEAQ